MLQTIFKPNKQKKRMIIRHEVSNDFFAAVASVPIVEQERPHKGMENICNLDAGYKNIHIKGKWNFMGMDVVVIFITFIQ